ncbi:MAG: long-chain fatty acid--CoA ligase [Myxococcales bacterium]|nr:MAG: long-chain fatty acid--CoA ligase [Myxococcales bacterium]
MSFEKRARFVDMLSIYREATSRFGSRPLFGIKQEGQWHWMSYDSFHGTVEMLRSALCERGLERGDRVACISNNRPEWAAAAYATYGFGGVFVPMYETQLAKDWKYILKNCAAKAVFVANHKIAEAVAGFRSELPDLKCVVCLNSCADVSGCVEFDSFLLEGKNKTHAMLRVDPEESCTFIYTSGTTGTPKGVMLSHRNIACNVSACIEVFPVSESDRSLSFLPWAHAFGQTVELHSLFAQGASMGIAESVDQIVTNLGEVKPTLLFSVPRIFNRIYAALHKKLENEKWIKKRLFELAIENEVARKKLAQDGRSSMVLDSAHRFFDRVVFSKVRERFGGQLRYAFSGGAAISKEVAEFIDNLGITVYEGYGLTETSPVATANRPGARKIGSVGQAVPGVSITIDSSKVSDEGQGEVVIHGHCVMQGYYGLDEENAKVFTKDGGFRSGDMGYLDEDGFLYLTGRIKEQYKLENGKYVSPGPLEEELKLSPYILNAMVYGENRPYNVALIVADLGAVCDWAKKQGLVVSGGSELLEQDEVRQLFEKEIAAHAAVFKAFEKIRKFALVAEDFTTENGMLTPTLKIKRRVVLARYGDVLNALYG